MLKNSLRFITPTLILSAIAAVFSQAIHIKFIKNYEILRDYILLFYFIWIVFISLVFIIDLLNILFKNRLKWLSLVFEKIFIFMKSVFSFVFKIFYLYPLKFLLKPVVNTIVSESLNFNIAGMDFQFSKTLSQRNDDHYFTRTVSVKNLIISIKPKGNNPRWRFGLKFTKDNTFTDNRYDKVKNILFHLTKDADKKILEYNLYQKDN